MNTMTPIRTTPIIARIAMTAVKRGSLFAEGAEEVVGTGNDEDGTVVDDMSATRGFSKQCWDERRPTYLKELSATNDAKIKDGPA
jgi:hypothetical protein